MLRGFLILLVFALSATQVAGQVNLVPNGSFEEFTICPDDFSQHHLNTAVGWYDPILCSTDFLHTCSYPGYFGIPTQMGGVTASHGDGMIAMLLRLSDEFAGIELDSALIAGEQYELSLDLHLGGPSYASIGSFGAYFSVDSATDFTLEWEDYLLPNQLQRDPDSIMSDFAIWYNWKDTLMAAGGEKFMIIGNFLPDNMVPFIQSGSTPASAYFVDNVKLIQVQEPDGIHDFTIEASFSPNPATDQLTITSDHPKLDISILSIAGQVLQTEQLIGLGSHQFNLNGLSSGVYFVRMQTSDGERVEKLVIQ